MATVMEGSWREQRDRLVMWVEIKMETDMIVGALPLPSPSLRNPTKQDELNLPITLTTREPPGSPDLIVLGWLEALVVNSASLPRPQDSQNAEYGYRGRTR